MKQNINNIIEITNVSKAFGSDSVLQDINLIIKNGEFITFLGPSGCGKTTLLRLISGFDSVDSGKIHIAGKDVTDIPPEERHLNMVFQSYALFPHMSVFDNVAFGLRCKNIAESEIKERVNEILRMVKLTEFANRKPAQLSGGQQQRVAVARAAVNKPLVLLLDEPLSALDYNLRKEMQIELKQLQRKLGITFIFVTHDQQEALSMSDRVVVMREGHIEQLGTPREVYEKPNSLYVAKFIGEANVFETTITSVKDDMCVVDIECKDFILDNDNDFPVGQKVNIVIRPEDIGVWMKEELDPEEIEVMLPGKVEQVVYKGSTVDLVVRLESGKLISATEFFDEGDEELDYQVGEKVWVEWVLGWEIILGEAGRQ